MKSFFLQAFVLCLGFRQSLAIVPWRTFGCDGFTFSGSDGSVKSLNEVWDNAVAMTTQAESQIDVIPKEPKIKLLASSAEKRAGANAEYMFGAKFKHDRGTPLGTMLSDTLGLGTDGATTMDAVKASFGNIRAALQANLGDLTPENAYFFCGAGALVKDRVPSDLAGPLPIWHLQIRNGDVTTYVLLSFVVANSPEPCTEVGDEGYLGKTFSSTVITEGQDPKTIYGVIVCPNQWNANPEVKVYPTLELGFKAEPQGGNRYPSPIHYNSHSGTLVHEMAHVAARTKGATWLDLAYGFVDSKKLAETNSAAAIKNPDSYRIFAEMSMSPDAKWNAPGS